MKLFAPRYYADFKCIADKCRDNCCIGWEIDIDEEREALYRGLSGELGELVRRAVYPSGEGGCAHFILTEGGRCPLLSESGLCRLISELGEGALTEICREHPRYYNLYSDSSEVGLGLCCEAAVKLVLDSPFESLISSEDTRLVVECGEDLPAACAFLPARAELYKRLEEPYSSAEELFGSLFSVTGGAFSLRLSELGELLSELESLDDGFLSRAAEGCFRAEGCPEAFSAFLEGFLDSYGRRLIAVGLHRHFLNYALQDSPECGLGISVILALSVALYLFMEHGACGKLSLSEKQDGTGPCEGESRATGGEGVAKLPLPEPDEVILATVLASKNLEYSEENTEILADFVASL